MFIRVRAILVPLILSFVVGGCATLPMRSFTEQQQAVAEIPGIPGARFWADDSKAFALAQAPEVAGVSRSMLALSGGADKGAYGAGFLNGWTQSGKRPVFAIVTGVSTGALLAPFAFLGTQYDDRIKSAFTTIGPRNIYNRRFPPTIPFSVSAASTKPLWQLINAYATNAVIDAVAEEHRRGRRLFVGTANLDAQRSVIWNMGTIAASDVPGRYDLFRRVLLASSAVPALFPPVIIEARSGTTLIPEAHIDGATASSLLAVPPGIVANGGMVRDPLDLYLLVNGALGGDFELVEGGLFKIASRAFSQSSAAAVREQAATAYLWSIENGAKYHLTYMDGDFEKGPKHAPFETRFMNRLYDYGYKRGLGASWSSKPPSGDPSTK